MTPTSGDGPAAGWYPDPHDRDQQRYWDGDAWTGHRHPTQAGSAPGGSPEDTAVLPRAEQPTRRPAEAPVTDRGSRGGAGWVPALVGLLVGLIIGGTAAAVIVGNNNDSSSPQSDSTSAPTSPVSTAVSTATATATESVTSTVTATVTVTASSSP